MSLFKHALADALTASEMNATDLGSKSGIHRSRISEFLAGKSLPKGDSIKLICAAFSPAIAGELGKAWVRQRLGDDLANSILAADLKPGSDLERVFGALPSVTQRAFMLLMKEARTEEDLRHSLESLASFITPPEEVKKKIAHRPSSGIGGLRMVAEEHDKDEGTAGL